MVMGCMMLVSPVGLSVLIHIMQIFVCERARSCEKSRSLIFNIFSDLLKILKQERAAYLFSGMKH